MNLSHFGSIVSLTLTLVLPASAQQLGTQSQSDLWASCAAAMTQRALIQEEIEKRSAISLHGAIGRYYLLSCAYSTPTAADAAYSRAREAQMEAFKRAASTCKVNSGCIASFVEQLEGKLLVCAGEQKMRSDDLAKVTKSVHDACNVEIKP